MLKLITITGTRPQIIKSAAISRAIDLDFSNKLKEVVIHTGQHYNSELDKIFYQELGVRNEAYNLNVGSKSHAIQTAEMMAKLEPILEDERPDAVLLYGDTNSTVAAALVAVKKKLPVIHVEAGVRAFKKRNPEEINRVLTDHMSALLFVPTDSAIKNLEKEGIKHSESDAPNADNPWVLRYDDILLDNIEHILKNDTVIQQTNDVLLTIHRPINTDNFDRLKTIILTIFKIAKDNKHTVYFPIHPRTKHILDNHNDAELKSVFEDESFKVLSPLSFTETIRIIKRSKMVFTDSGGLQKESFVLGKPCIVLNDATAWSLLVEHGTSVLVNDSPIEIERAYLELISARLTYPPFFGEVGGSKKILEMIIDFLSKHETLS